MLRFMRLGLMAGLVGCLAGPQAKAACTLAKFADLPITMSGTRPMVAAKINGHDVMLMADSGAFFSMLSPAIASELKLPLYPAPFGFRVGGVGGSNSVDLTRVTFTLTKYDIPKVEFMVGAGAGGDGSAGLLGQNILGVGDAEYDLAGGVIRLLRPKGCGATSMAYWATGKPYSVIDITYENGASKKFIGVAYVNGKRIRVLFDTGASTSVMTRAAAERAGVNTTTPGVVSGGFSHGVGPRAARTYIAHFDSFKIGDEEIKNTRLRFSDFELEDLDMLLGADFFLSHHIYVSNDQRKLYFTYNGGPVFNLSVQPLVAAGDETPGRAKPSDVGSAEASSTNAKPGDPAPASPSVASVQDASDIDRRAAAEAGRHDYAHAIADFDKAIAIAPNEGRYRYQRALAELDQNQIAPATLDVDEALRLKPDFVEALILRANVRRRVKDRAGAVADLDRAGAAASSSSDLRLNLGATYNAMGLLDQAIAQYDLWIAAHADDGQMVAALASRCRARVLLNRDLNRALGDCNRAIGLGPVTGAMYDSRGLVQLRQGHDDDAIADYNRALALRPKSVWSLYGRGVAKLHKGDKASGDADIAAALQISPRFSETAGRFGFATPGTPASANVAPASSESKDEAGPPTDQ